VEVGQVRVQVRGHANVFVRERLTSIILPETSERSNVEIINAGIKSFAPETRPLLN
jgi:hypothetical protein